MDAPGTTRLERHACFGGWQDVYRHRSRVLGERAAHDQEQDENELSHF